MVGRAATNDGAVEGSLSGHGRRYVFLASSPYSGSTLLSVLLGEHPDISTTSDVSGQRRSTRMDTFACSCGRLMRECPFWLEVAERMRKDWPDFDLADFGTGFDVGPRGVVGQLRSGSLRLNVVEHLRDRFLATVHPSTERELREAAARSQALAETVMDITDSHVFLDASKERLRARYLARHVSLDVRVIHLLRDPRGVTDSSLRRHADAGESVERAARRWVSAQRVIDRVLDDMAATPWLRIRYEELCMDVAGTMRRLYEFCGVDPDVELRDPPQQHLLGNKMRLRSYGEIRPDDRWRTNLSRGQQQTVMEIAGPMATRLGVVDDAGPGS